MINNILPLKWVTVRLGDICKTTSGGTPSRKNASYYSGNIPWLKSGELEYNVINTSEEKITNEALENSSSKIIAKGTILMALYGATVGKLAILGFNAAINQAICAMFVPKEIENKFVYWYLFGHRDELLNSRKGGAQPNISQQIVNDILIPIPPLNEQYRIVAKIEELFTKLDVGIEALKKTQLLLKQYRQSVLKYAFEGKLTEKWRKYNKKKIQDSSQLISKITNERSQNELTSFITDFNLCRLPSDWLWITIGMVENFIGSGVTPRGGKNVYVNSGIPFIRSQNVYPDGLHLDDIVYVTEEMHKQMSRTHVKPGDVLLNITGASIGRSTFVPSTILHANVNQHVCIIRTDIGILPAFLSNWLNSFTAQRIINSVNKGVTRQGLNYSHIRSIPLPLLSLAEQYEILKQIDSMFSIIRNNEKTILISLKKINSLRNAILQTAFSGKLLRQDPKDEPAEILLERIKQDKAKSDINSNPKKTKIKYDDKQKRLI